MAKQKWEEKYENFRSGKLQGEIDALTSKMAGIKAEQAQLKEGPEYGKKKAELEKIKKQITEKKNKANAIGKNADKIENILKLKKELVDSTAKLLDKQKEYEKADKEYKQAEEDCKQSDKDREKLTKRLEEIENELKKSNISEEEKGKLESEKQEKLKGVLENDQKYGDIVKKRDETKARLEKYNNKEIKSEILKNEKLLGKCDLIGANLVKGKSMEDITTALNNFKFTPNKDFAKKIDEARKENSKGKEEKEKQEGEKAGDNEEAREEKDGQEEKTEEKENKEEIKDNNAVEQEKEETIEEEIEPSRFMKAINKIKKRFPFIDKMANKVKGVFSRKGKLPEAKNIEEDIKDEDIKDEVAEEVKKMMDEKEEQKDTSNKDFEYTMKYLDGQDQDKVLAEITEKGMSSFRESIKVSKEEQYKAMKDAAAIDYAMRYKGRYKQQDGINQEEPDDGSR